MTCPHCGAQNIPDGAAVCPECRHELPSAAPGARPRAEVPPAATTARKPYALAGIFAAIIVVLIVALILALRPKSPVTQAPATAPPVPGPPVTQAPTPQPPATGPPVTAAPEAKPPAPTPEDPNKAAVQAYLNRVSYIEKQRQAVVNNLAPALLEASLLQQGMDNPLLGPMSDLLAPDPEAVDQAKQKAKKDTPNEVQQVIDGYVGQLRTLDEQLRKIQPVPQPAFAFARAYDEAFAAYAGAMVQIGQMMQVGLQDPNQARAQAGKLSAMKGDFQLRAQQGLNQADQQLTALCQKYGLPKPFDITDTPGGNITGMG